MLKRVVLTGLVLLALFAIVVAFQPSHYRVERSIQIVAPTLTVFDYVNDFNRWAAWSPWTRLDPQARFSAEGAPSGQGAVLVWSGNDAVGSGRMEIVESRLGSSVDIATTFHRPIAGKSSATFRFSRLEDNKTEVTWTIEGTHSFLAKALSLFVGSDRALGPEMERGLVFLQAAADAQPPPALPAADK